MDISASSAAAVAASPRNSRSERPFAPMRHRLDVSELLALLGAQTNAIMEGHYRANPWSPATAPRLQLLPAGN